MLQANPAAVGARNRNNLTPLHFALGCTTVEINAPAKTILELLDVFPEAARVKNACAELPLHIAVAKRAPLEVLSRLVDIYPGACIECNCWGSLPLHVGLVNNLQWAEIRLLVEAAPETVGELDEDGKTPVRSSPHLAHDDTWLSKLVSAENCLRTR